MRKISHGLVLAITLLAGATMYHLYGGQKKRANAQQQNYIDMTSLTLEREIKPILQRITENPLPADIKEAEKIISAMRSGKKSKDPRLADRYKELLNAAKMGGENRQEFSQAAQRYAEMAERLQQAALEKTEENKELLNRLDTQANNAAKQIRELQQSINKSTLAKTEENKELVARLQKQADNAAEQIQTSYNEIKELKAGNEFIRNQLAQLNQTIAQREEEAKNAAKATQEYAAELRKCQEALAGASKVDDAAVGELRKQLKLAQDNIQSFQRSKEIDTKQAKTLYEENKQLKEKANTGSNAISKIVRELAAMKTAPASQEAWNDHIKALSSELLDLSSNI